MFSSSDSSHHGFQHQSVTHMGMNEAWHASLQREAVPHQKDGKTHSRQFTSHTVYSPVSRSFHVLIIWECSHTHLLAPSTSPDSHLLSPSSPHHPQPRHQANPRTAYTHLTTIPSNPNPNPTPKPWHPTPSPTTTANSSPPPGSASKPNPRYATHFH